MMDVKKEGRNLGFGLLVLGTVAAIVGIIISLVKHAPYVLVGMLALGVAWLIGTAWYDRLPRS